MTTSGGTAAQRWRDDLASWAIPDGILAAAPQDPWIHPVEMFAVVGDVPDSPSHRRAREALPEGGSVLDVGCGGGRASAALADRRPDVTGVDASERMLASYAEAMDRLGLLHTERRGRWPDDERDAPDADVVVCHHVLFNVADLPEFLLALGRHARRRVVCELPLVHPLTHMSPLWRRFWDLDRPTTPTARDCLDVAHEAGLPAQLEVWDDEPFEAVTPLTAEQRAHHLRVRLCLPAEREPEVLAALLEQGPPPLRRTATLWWDAA
jgi:SAM-dependent methyltransferase